jgi:hypothetical protein
MEGVSPYHSQAFSVSKIHKDAIIKEVEKLCKLGPLDRQPASEWASSSFLTPKKNETVCFLNNLWEVNKRLVRKCLPIPKISTVLQELEGFSFATALNLNMGYYTIRLYPDASKICTIIFPCGKYSYKQLAMGGVVHANVGQKVTRLTSSQDYVEAHFLHTKTSTDKSRVVILHKKHKQPS